MDTKVKYYLRLYYKDNGEFIREIPCKNHYIAERQCAFYNEVTTNLKAEIRVEEIK